MKAILIRAFGAPVEVGEIPPPRLKPGCVIVEVEAGYVSASQKELADGNLKLVLPPLPFVPGMNAVGTVIKKARDVTHVSVGEKVYCNHYVVPDGHDAAGAFVGLGGFTPASQQTINEWPNGSFAEQIMLPAACMTPLGAAGFVPAAHLARLGHIGTAYGGLMRGELQPGQTVVINGGTGAIGTSAVLLALAMGADRIVPLGRRTSILKRLKAIDPKRIHPVAIDKKNGPDGKEIAEVAGGAHVVLDCLNRTTDPSSTLAAIGALRPGGIAVLVGGLQAPLDLSYGMLLGLEIAIRGSLWFPRSAAAEMLSMIAADTLDLRPIEAHAYPLDMANDAFAHAVKSNGLEHVVLMPNA